MHRRCLEFLLSLGLAAATLLTYAPVFGNGFINLDDNYYVTDNPHVKAGLTADSLAWAWTTIYAGYWQPLTWMSLQLDAEWYGSAAAGYHATNILLHTANVVLLFLVLRRMTRAVWRSALVAALFAVHPLHVESVAWVTERKDVLSTFFGLLALGAYVRYAQRPGVGRYLAVVILFALSLMAKPMLVTFPCLLLLLDFWPLGRLHFGPPAPAARGRRKPDVPAFQPTPWRRLLAEKAPLFALAAAAGIVTVATQQHVGAVHRLGDLTLGVRVGNALVSYVLYLTKTAWPEGLAVYYPHAAYPPLAWQPLAAAAALAALTALAARAARRWAYTAVGWLWFVGALLPVIGLVQVGNQAMADRFTYVPHIGLFMALVWGAAELLGRWRCPPAAQAVLAGGVLTAFAACTWVQTGYWHDSVTLWRHALAVTPANTTALNHLGVALAERGEPGEAVPLYAAALRLGRPTAETYTNLGVALADLGNVTEATEQFTRAVALDPDHVEANTNLALMLRRQGRLDEAIARYRAVLRLSPDYALAHANLGSALAMQGKLDEAIEEFATAVRLDPDLTEARQSLGKAKALRRQGGALATPDSSGRARAGGGH
jgi:Flp pilus assembly protein TadD